MLTVNLIKGISGHITVMVYDIYTDEMLNLCMQNGVTLKNVRKRDKCIFMEVSTSDKKLFDETLRKGHIPYETVKEKGILYIAKKYKHRYALIAGAVLAACFVFFMSSFIWSIKIDGNLAVSDEEILKVLADNGFEEGRMKKKQNYYLLYQSVILAEPRIAWISINIKGTRAEVEVLEREIPPVIDDEKTPSDIVAGASGIIKEIKVYAGTPLVKVGDAVEKGDVIVSGLVTNLDGTQKYVSAKALVKADTLYTLRYICPPEITEFYETGREIKKYSLKIFNFNIKLGLNSRISFERYDKITVDNQLCLGKEYYIPIHLICDTYKELSPHTTALDEEMQLSISRLALEESIENLLPYAEVTEKTLKSYQQGENLAVEMEIKCTEDISIKLPVLEETDDRTNS